MHLAEYIQLILFLILSIFSLETWVTEPRSYANILDSLFLTPSPDNLKVASWLRKLSD